MTEREFRSIEDRYKNHIVFKKGKLIRRDLDLVLLIKINDQINEISKKQVLLDLIKKINKEGSR
jgi:hypothetical protein